MPETSCFDSFFLKKAAEGEVSSAEFEELTTHLQTCEACMQRFDQAIFTDARNFIPTRTEHVVEQSRLPYLERLKAIHQWHDLPELGQRFQLIRLIGRGGMGEVYECFDKKLNRPVALKKLRPDRLTDELFARLNREARIQAGLNHPNIVQIYEIGNLAGVPFIAMEYVDGKSLRDLVQEKPLEPRKAALLVARTARGVHYAHQAGVLHRDLKPSNILLGTYFFVNDSDQQVALMPKIADFGLAKMLEEPSELSKSNLLVGTIYYLAPEQATGRRAEIGPASDIYSLGVILFECLTGHPPFDSHSPSMLMSMIEAIEPISPRKLVPGISRDLETIILKCLEKRPKLRYKSAEALANDLERYLNGQPIEARPVSRPGQWLRWCNRNRPLAVALGLIFLLCVGLLCGLIFFSLEQARLRADAELESKRTSEFAKLAVAERDRAIESNLHEIAMLSNAIGYLKDENRQLLKSTEFDHIRKSLIISFQRLTDNFMNKSQARESRSAETTAILYHAARLGQALNDEYMMERRVGQIMELATQPKHQKQPELTFHMLAYLLLANHYEAKSKPAEATKAWGKAWAWVSGLEPDLIRSTQGLGANAVMIAEKYQAGLTREGQNSQAEAVARELEELRARVGPGVFPPSK